MKKVFSILSVFVLGMVALSSCSGDDNDGGGNGGDGIDTTVTDDKKFLEDTGKEFVGMFTAEQAAPYTSIINAIKDSDTKDVGEQIDDIINELKRTTESPNLTVYKYAIKASAFRGRYVMSNGVWYKNPGDGFVAEFQDDKGRICVLNATFSGATKKVILYEENRKRYIYYSDYTNYDITNEQRIYEAELPSHIECVLTQGGSQLATVVVNLDLSNLYEGQRIELSRNSLNLDCVADFVGLAKVTVAKASYQAQGVSSVNVVVEKAGKQILTANASSQSYLAGAPENMDDNLLKNVTNTVLDMDILGKVQIKGTCDNIGMLKDALENADDYHNQYEEQKVRQYVNQANNLLKVSVYYYNKPEVRATLKFDVDKDESYRWDYNTGQSYMTYRYFPTASISFPDGSSYFMANYFNEDAFKSLVDMFNDLTKKVEDQVDTKR